jgi:cell division septum initiation protein DivIVA
MYETDQEHGSDGSQTVAGTAGSEGAPADYSQFGEHVASVLKAAEAAAERLAEDARRQATDILGQAKNVREQADVYAEQKQREVDAETAKLLEAAELSAARRVQDARQRNEALHKDLELTEKRLQDLVTGLRTLASHLEDLLGPGSKAGVDEALHDSLSATVGAGASAHGDK